MLLFIHLNLTNASHIFVVTLLPKLSVFLCPSDTISKAFFKLIFFYFPKALPFLFSIVYAVHIEEKNKLSVLVK